jgi:predicted RecA/RadA family phage recombinase
MKNYVQKGDVVTLTTDTSGAQSGDVFAQGSLIGIVCADAWANSDVEVALTGVYDLPKGAEQIDQGAAVYWTGSAVTTTSASNKLLGAAILAAATNDPSCRVRLNGISGV